MCKKLSQSKIEEKKKNPYFYIVVTSEKAQLEKNLQWKSSTNSLFRLKVLVKNGSENFRISLKLPFTGLSFPKKRETIERNQLVGECRNTTKSTFAVWTSKSYSMCRLYRKKTQSKKEESQKISERKNEFLVNFLLRREKNLTSLILIKWPLIKFNRFRCAVNYLALLLRTTSYIKKQGKWKTLQRKKGKLWPEKRIELVTHW